MVPGPNRGEERGWGRNRSGAGFEDEKKKKSKISPTFVPVMREGKVGRSCSSSACRVPEKRGGSLNGFKEIKIQSPAGGLGGANGDLPFIASGRTTRKPNGSKAYNTLQLSETMKQVTTKRGTHAQHLRRENGEKKEEKRSATPAPSSVRENKKKKRVFTGIAPRGRGQGAPEENVRRKAVVDLDFTVSERKEKPAAYPASLRGREGGN